MRALPFAALLLAAPAAAQLSPAEKTMRATVNAEAGRHEALLQKLVEQNSGTMNPAGVKAVADMLRPEFEALGFAVRWADMRETGRAGHLIATHKGNGRGKRMLLIGHLDTVFEPDNPFKGWKREGTEAEGPGSVDMKGGDVVILAALRAMKAAGTLAGADVTVVFTGDEERTGAPIEVARRDLIAAAKASDVALEFESLVTDDKAEYGTVARRGSITWEVKTTGKTGHSSVVFGPIGYGAIYEAARIADAFRRELTEPSLTYNIGLIAGGTPATLDADGVRATASGKPNIVAADAVMRGDLRALTHEQAERVQAKMRGIVEKHLPGTGATITFFDGMPPMSPDPRNTALLAALNRTNRDLGLPQMAAWDPAKRGASDAGCVSPYLPVLAGLGASGGSAHAAGEWVDLASLPRQATRVAVLMSRLAAQPRSAPLAATN
jgi:glutamate carboxypeptidase